jgi:hypothetical protein
MLYIILVVFLVPVLVPREGGVKISTAGTGENVKLGLNDYGIWATEKREDKSKKKKKSRQFEEIVSNSTIHFIKGQIRFDLCK